MTSVVWTQYQTVKMDAIARQCRLDCGCGSCSVDKICVQTRDKMHNERPWAASVYHLSFWPLCI